MTMLTWKYLVLILVIYAGAVIGIAFALDYLLTYR